MQTIVVTRTDGLNANLVQKKKKKEEKRKKERKKEMKIEHRMKEYAQQVSVKVSESAVNGWFSIFEAHFHQRNVTIPKIKFDTVVMSPPAGTMAKLPIATPQPQDYEDRRRTLIEAHKK